MEMIPRIICFFFGRSWREQKATGEQYDALDPLTKVPCRGLFTVWEECKRCPRCGKKLKENNNE